MKKDIQNFFLHKHNQETYLKVLGGFSQANKVLIEQPTGTGKSYVALQYLKDHAKAKKVLYVCPTNVIKDQFEDNFAEFIGSENEISLEMSLYAGLKKKKEEKYDVILLDEVHRARAKIWGQSVQSLLNNNPNAKVLGMSATLERADGRNVALLFDGKEPASRITFADAIAKGILPTPKYTMTKIDFNDDLKEFDKQEEKLSSMLIGASKGDEKRINEYLAQIKHAKKLISERKEVPDIFKESLSAEELKNGKFIVFCPMGTADEEEDEASKLQMEKIMEQAKSWFSGEVREYCVHSKFDKSKNKKSMQAFEKDNASGVKLMFAVNMLNEGVHVKGIDGVIMLRSTESRITYLQQLGRALASGASKNPKIFDFVSNLNSVDIDNVKGLAGEVNKSLEKKGKADKPASRFSLKVEDLDKITFISDLRKNVYGFLTRLDLTYAGVKQLFTDYRQANNIPEGEKAIVKKGAVFGRYKIGHVLTLITARQLPFTKQQYAELDKFDLELYKLAFDFEKFYNHLIEFKNENKIPTGEPVRVPQIYICEDGYKLGQKVSNVRTGNIKLTKEQETKLNEIKFVWDATQKFDFEKFYNHLIEFKKENKIQPGESINVPQIYICEDGYKLGQKVFNVRRGNIKLTKEQETKLNEIKFVWNMKQRFDFGNFYDHLLKYKEDNRVLEGDPINVPKSYICKDGYKLWKHVSQVRRGRTKLTEEQKNRLNEIKFVWDAKRFFDFENFHNHLLAYRTENKIADGEPINATCRYICADGYKLGQSVMCVRCGAIKLTEEQKTKLDKINFVWSVRKSKGKKGIAKSNKFYKNARAVKQPSAKTKDEGKGK